MANMTSSAKRYRFQVPAADESVQEWIAAQINISSSLRQLIREDIQKNGFTDVTCRAVEQGAKRGRPTNAELARRAEEEVDVVTETMKTEIREKQEEKPVNIPEPQVRHTVPTSTFHVTDTTPKNPSMDALKDLLG